MNKHVPQTPLTGARSPQAKPAEGSASGAVSERMQPKPEAETDKPQPKSESQPKTR
jgi:hypothetical protein